MHTTASDGTDTPREVVQLAKRSGFSLIAITDHDTMQGVAEAQEAGKALGVRIIPGVEISAGGQTEVHVLGYGVRDVEKLEDVLRQMQKMRQLRMVQMVDKLSAMGIDIRLEEVQALSGGIIGRSHLARVLVQKGVVRDVREAFIRYLSPGKPGFVARKKLTVEDAVSLITTCGGLAVIAHPGQNHGEKLWPAERFRALKPYGLRGIEVYHLAHAPLVISGFERIARSEGLLVTGGSDYHGQVKTVTIGQGLERWRTSQTDLNLFLKALGE
ncbi:MAG: PHP domain-containing protein [Clostridia bacterium]|nr:PHP domain-containing protein [Clostridia bacterium]